MPVRSLARALPAALAAAALVTPAAAGARTSGHAVASAARAPKHCANTHVVPTRAQPRARSARAILCLHNQIRAQHRPAAAADEPPSCAAPPPATRPTWSASATSTTRTPNGSTFVDRIARAALRHAPNHGWTLGENLAWGTGDLATAAGVMRAWMNSPGHRANILKRAYREVGIGITLGVADRRRTSARPSRPTSAPQLSGRSRAASR